MEEGAGLREWAQQVNLEASPGRFIPCAPTMLGKAGASGKIIEFLRGCNHERSKNGFKAKGFTSLRSFYAMGSHQVFFWHLFLLVGKWFYFYFLVTCFSCGCV